jgi:nitrite reductase/ring-hydroxylating ferredoxin subunit
MDHDHPNRRDLIATAAVAGAALVAACGCGGGAAVTRGKAAHAEPLAPGASPIDVGTAESFSTDGVHDRFAATDEFFVVREGSCIYAMPAVCTHRDCPLKLINNVIKCRCHGSTFSPTGHVTRGPAKVDLSRIPIERNASGRIIVHVDREPLPPGDVTSPGAFVTVG